MRTPQPRLIAASGLLLVAAAGLPACSSADDSGTGLNVVASFYPLQFVSEVVGGDHIDVTNLTAAGAEPHDMELKPRQVADIVDAELVVYLDGFQPAVDKAVETQASDSALDVAKVAKPHKTAPDHEHEGEDKHEGDHDHEGDHEGDPDHEGDHEGDHDHDHGGIDPHVWLDPTKLDKIAGAVAGQLSKIDPDHAKDFKANAKTLSQKLTTLDEDFSQGLSNCDSRDIVTSHAAFGYLANRYDLHQVAISGLSPEASPGAGAMKEIMDYVDEHGVNTIFYESLVSPKVADKIAEKTGARTAVLDPIEGLSKGSDEDYLSIMESNLSTLKKSLECR